MALIWGDRVLETTTTAGAGPFALAGAVTGYQRFSGVATIGDTLYAAIFAVDSEGVPSGDWQAGLATYSASNELTFTSVTASSNGGNELSFAGGAKWVIACPTADYFAGLAAGGGETVTADEYRVITDAPGSSGDVGWGEIYLYAGDEIIAGSVEITGTASSSLTGFDAQDAFDTQVSSDNGWRYDSGAETAISSYIQATLATPAAVDRIGLRPIANLIGAAPEGFTVQVFLGGTWVSVGSFTTTWSTSASKQFNLEPLPIVAVNYLPLTGGTTSGPISVPDDAYDATGWNGNLEVPTKNAIRDMIEALAATIPAAGASTTQTAECIAGFIATPADKDYRLVVKIPHGGTITETTTRSASGTCTATFKVNTTALGGTANSVSSSEQSQAHASTNTFSAADDIVLTVSSNSSCADMSFSIKYTRTLD